MRRFLLLTLGLGVTALGVVVLIQQKTQPAHAQNATPDVLVTATHIQYPKDKLLRCGSLRGTATHTSVRSGNWSDPATWSSNSVPADNANVQVAHSLRYDVTAANAKKLGCVEIGEGATLDFDPQIATVLKVYDGLSVYPNITYSDGTKVTGGTLIIGTQSNPAQSAIVEFLDSPLNTNLDPQQFSKSLNAGGNVTIHGQPKTTFARVNGDIPAGATTIALDEAVTGWNVGDRVYFPETRSAHGKEFKTNDLTTNQRRLTPLEKEYRTVTAISPDGKTITLNAALQWAHPCARDRHNNIPTRRWDGQKLCAVVANVSRSVTLRSENPDGVHGHNMFLHRAKVDIRYASIKDMGRTTIAPLDSTTFNPDGTVLHLGTNQIGRYALHLHHVHGERNGTTGDPSGHQFTLIGNDIDSENSPVTVAAKWGIAIHNSSFGLIKDNVVVDQPGAGIATEDGNEWQNIISHNFISASVGNALPSGADGEQNRPNPMASGNGIGLAHVGNTVEKNIIQGLGGNVGINIFAQFALGAPRGRVPKFPGADPSVDFINLGNLLANDRRYQPPFRENEIAAVGGVKKSTGILHWEVQPPGGYLTQDIALWNNFFAGVANVAIVNFQRMERYQIYQDWDASKVGVMTHNGQSLYGFGFGTTPPYLREEHIIDSTVDRAYRGVFDCPRRFTMTDTNFATYSWGIQCSIADGDNHGETPFSYMHLRNPVFEALPNQPLKTISLVNGNYYPLGFAGYRFLPLGQWAVSPRINVYNFQNSGQNYELVRPVQDPTTVTNVCGGESHYDGCVKKRMQTYGFARCMEDLEDMEELPSACAAARALGQQLSANAIAFPHTAPLVDFPTPTGTDQIMPGLSLAPQAFITFPPLGGEVNADDAEIFVKMTADADELSKVKDMRLALDNQPPVTLPLPALSHSFGAITPGAHTATLYLTRPDDSQIPYTVVTIPFNASRPSQNPVVELKFDEGSGTSTADSSGNGNHGTLMGSTQWSTETPLSTGGGSLYFDGKPGTRVAVATSPTLRLGDFTLTAWAKTRSTSKLGCIVSRHHPGNLNFGIYTMLSGYNICLGDGTVAGKIATWLGFTNLVGQSRLNDGGWHFVATTAKGNNFQLYRDGTLEASSRADRSNPSVIIDPLHIGARVTVGSYTGYFEGNIDNVRIYNRVLSAAEIQTLASEGGLQPPPLAPPRYDFTHPYQGAVLPSGTPVVFTFTQSGDPNGVDKVKLTVGGMSYTADDGNAITVSLANGAYTAYATPARDDGSPVPGGVQTSVAFRVGSAAATTGGMTTGGMNSGGTSGGGMSSSPANAARLSFMAPANNATVPASFTASVQGTNLPLGSAVRIEANRGVRIGIVPLNGGIATFQVNNAPMGSLYIAAYAVNGQGQMLRNVAPAYVYVTVASSATAGGTTGGGTTGTTGGATSSSPPAPYGAPLCFGSVRLAGFDLVGNPQPANTSFTVEVFANGSLLGTDTATVNAAGKLSFAKPQLLSAISSKMTQNADFIINLDTPYHFTASVSTKTPLMANGQCLPGIRAIPGNFSGHNSATMSLTDLRAQYAFLTGNLSDPAFSAMYGTLSTFTLNHLIAAARFLATASY